MKIYSSMHKVFLKKDIDFMDSFDILSKYISYSLCQMEDYKQIHNQNRYKHYNFSTIYPPQKDKVYKKGEIYSFIIRGLDEKFIKELSTKLRENINNPYLQVLDSKLKTTNQFFINELYSISPTIVTVKKEDGKRQFWTVQSDGDIMKLIKQLQDNLEKKYKDFYKQNIKPTQNFIQLIEIKNQKPQSIYFRKTTNEQEKRVRLFGNKFQFVINEDEVSQKLAFLALGSGMGEKNSFGGGYCLWN